MNSTSRPHTLELRQKLSEQFKKRSPLSEKARQKIVDFKNHKRGWLALS